MNLKHYSMFVIKRFLTLLELKKTIFFEYTFDENNNARV